MSALKVSTDKADLDIDFIYDFLSQSYWAKNRSRAHLELSIENSICFGANIGDVQVGFARILTDKVVFAYLMDFFIGPEYQGKGYGLEFIKYILNHKDVVTASKVFLGTKDAHGLYRKVGFHELKRPETWMEL